MRGLAQSPPIVWLHLFSGPSGGRGGFSVLLEIYGGRLVDYDLFQDPVAHKLADEHVWQEFRSQLVVLRSQCF